MTIRDHLGPRTPENAALHDELDRLEAALYVVLVEAAEIARECVLRYADPVPPILALSSTAALDRVIRAHVEKALEMARIVKPLEWIDGKISDHHPRFTASSPFGSYEALQWSSGDYGWSAPHPDHEDRNIEYGGLTSIEDAKAAAQADYQTRSDAMRRAITADDVLREMGGRG